MLENNHEMRFVGSKIVVLPRFYWYTSGKGKEGNKSVVRCCQPSRRQKNAAAASPRAVTKVDIFFISIVFQMNFADAVLLFLTLSLPDHFYLQT